MNYLYVSKKKNPRSLRLIWTMRLCVFILIILLIVFGSTLFSILTNSWKGQSYISQNASLAPAWLGNNTDLTNSLDELKSENDDLKARITSLEAVEATYHDLLGEIGTTTKEEILAKIIRRPPFTIFDTYIIDMGKNAGVEVDDLVFAHDMPVGFVKSVTNNNSVISLYSSPDEKLLISFGTSSSQYQAYGIGNAGIRADLPRNIEIEKETKVILGDRKVSVIGVVHSVDKDPNDTYQSVYISLPFDISNTGWLSIRKK